MSQTVPVGNELDTLSAGDRGADNGPSAARGNRPHLNEPAGRVGDPDLNGLRRRHHDAGLPDREGADNRPELRLDWIDGRAARYACEKWHYTRSVPNAGVRIGVWEGEDNFVGVILFGVGAARSTDGRKYGLAQTKDVAELVRVALKPGHVWPVSRCVAIAIRMLRRQSPGLRLLISFADAAQGHHGGIYQAGNWIYAGTTTPHRAYFIKGQRKHPRTISSNGWRSSLEWLRENVDPAARIEITPPKHRYLYPLDDEIRARIAPLAKPYPKRT